jgi:prepilin-type N-terminal cleavage/methylation domain-containing protein
MQTTLRQRAMRGFTLIELLIVVIIIAILAAIAIPQFSNSSGDAQEAALDANLATMRSAIELYRVQHGNSCMYRYQRCWWHQQRRRLQGTDDLFFDKRRRYLLHKRNWLYLWPIHARHSCRTDQELQRCCRHRWRTAGCNGRRVWLEL